MKSLITSLLLGFVLISCDNCKDEPKHFNAGLYPAVRRTFYDWDKVEQVSGDTIYFGVGTGYFKCKSSGEEELLSDPVGFYTDRNIVIYNDTIEAMANLLNENRISEYISFYKETDAFYNSPQYLIRLDNKTLKLSDYYTFYFKGLTESGVGINDSTIVFVE